MKWQDINGEKDSKSSEPVPKQTPALTEIEVIAMSLVCLWMLECSKQ